MSSLCSNEERLGRSVSPPCPTILTTTAPPSPPRQPRSSILLDDHFERSSTENQAHYRTVKEFTEGGRSQVTIDMIPDVALLRIFDFCLDESRYEQEWHLLVHVCRRWRSIVFGSPLRLNLRLYCKARTPVRETLDVWPPLPIVIKASSLEQWRNDNTIVALEHNDRVCQVDLFLIPRSQLEKVLAAMQQQFPALTHLRLGFEDDTEPVHSDSFLGGSAPHLQSLTLCRIPFPGLPKLLLSTTHLVDLQLTDIPHSGYIAPEALVTCLSMLTRLKLLMIGFRSPRSRPDRRNQRLPPQTCTLLPVLTGLWFEGVSEYVEDLTSRIDAPLLDNLRIHYFPQLIFNTPRLTQFISRTPKLKTCRVARLKFCDIGVYVTLRQLFEEMEFKISFRRSDWQLSSLTQVFSSSLPQNLTISVERLDVLKIVSSRYWQDDIESSQLLDLLRPFSSVKYLHISREFVPHITPTLQVLAREGVTEVLPALQKLFLEEPLPSGAVQETIEEFIAARQVSGHPVTISGRGKMI